MSLVTNRKAYHDYEILEEFETGIKLLGYEVKSLKEGRGNLTGSYVIFKKGSLMLIGFNLPPYSKAGEIFNYNPTRTRKLLMHQSELNYLSGKVESRGYTLVPLKFYTKGSLIKLSVGLARGKKKLEKKETLIQKQQERQTQREISDLQKGKN